MLYAEIIPYEPQKVQVMVHTLLRTTRCRHWRRHHVLALHRRDCLHNRMDSILHRVFSPQRMRKKRRSEVPVQLSPRDLCPPGYHSAVHRSNGRRGIRLRRQRKDLLLAKMIKPQIIRQSHHDPSLIFIPLSIDF